jgi:uncharacterized protein (DUF2141 family)
MARLEPFEPGTTFTKRVEQRINRGDLVQYRVGPSGKPYAIRVIEDIDGDSTLRDDRGVKFGKKGRTGDRFGVLL